jgi:hypothetical protein
MLSSMRFGFGGHAEGSEPIDPNQSPKTCRAAPAGPHTAH